MKYFKRKISQHILPFNNGALKDGARIFKFK